MTEYAVIPDTNVIVSTSIFYRIPGSRLVIKHEFHDEAVRLFSLLDRPDSGWTGYLVPTVEAESDWVLSNAVKSAIFSTVSRHPELEGDIFKNTERAIIVSRRRMTRLKRRLKRADLDEGRIAANLARVEEMSAYLLGLWKGRTGKAAGGPDAADVVQLRRFARRHPDLGDERILAEAGTLGEAPGFGGRVVVIASFDSSFFSPHIGPRGVSDIVTREILRRLGVRCDHPGAVARMLEDVRDAGA